MAEIQVKTEPTENHQEMKFHIGKTISKEQVEYASSGEAFRSPIARKIFGFPWTDRVTVGTDFVCVTKQEWVDWEVLEEPLKGLIGEHFDHAFSEGEDVEENPELPKSQVDLSSPQAQRVKEIIDQQINPAVAGHGGFINLINVENNKVFVRLEGGCQGCSMSMATLKEGIETTLKTEIPEIEEVVDVTDHDMGANPYFS